MSKNNQTDEHKYKNECKKEGVNLFFGSFFIHFSKLLKFMAAILVGVIFFWLYGTLTMMVMKGRTISMRLIDVKVVKKDGSALKPLDVIMR